MKTSKLNGILYRLKSQKSPLLYIAGFAAIGSVLLFATHAATPFLSIEPESGTIAGNARTGQDTTASNGSFVSFSTASACPSGQTGIPPNCAPIQPNNVTGGTDSSCVFRKATLPMHLAFCDGFGTAYNNPASANRSGDLDNKLWGVSRTNTFVNPSQGMYNTWLAATIKGCGADIFSQAPRDVRVCNGRLQEAVNDGHTADGVFDGGQSTLAIYPKQPFDISGGRTGTVVFDVSADSSGSHNAWPEFWWTDQPIPAPVDHRSAQSAVPRNGLGIIFASDCPVGMTGVHNISAITNYTVSEVPIGNGGGGCTIKSSTATDTALNHIEIRISQTHLEVWGSDPGSSTMILMAAGDMNLTMTKGLTWMLDAHYNACKEGFGTSPQCDHAFAWDNFGFDGPGTYRDLSFDVIDNNDPYNSYATNLAYGLPNNGTKELTVNGVYRVQTPTSALATFNWFPTTVVAVPSFRIKHGTTVGPWHDTPWPYPDTNGYAWRTIGVSVPVSEIADGTNIIEFKNPQPGDELPVSNINLILVAGSPVPTAVQ